MTDEFLGARRRALEESFFARHNQQLLAELRHQMELEQAAELMGIEDVELLHKLESLGVKPASYTALALVPLVEVAWADGTMADKEREAVLEAARQAGIAPGSAARQALETWLEHRPASALRHAWTAYIGSLTERMDAGERARFQAQVMQRARQVAEVSGGLMGLGDHISAAEREKLAELDEAFGGR